MILTIFHKLFRRDANPVMVKVLARIFEKVNFRLLAYLSGLVFISILSFGISVDSFFVADDMWQVNFTDNVFNGRTELIWKNFTSNYLQLPGFDFYRPLLGFTYLFDFFAYKVWAPGWHITSLFLYITSVVILFFLFRRLTRTWPSNNSQSASYFGAALFAVSPLHCEDVCWISGRADLLCAPFYLLALFFIVKSHQEGKRKFYFLALMMFVLAMMSKEIGIGLPLVIFAYYFFWPFEDEFYTPVDMPQYGKSNYQKERITRHKQHLARVLQKQIKKKEKKKKQKEEASEASEASLIQEDEEVQDESQLTLKDRFLLAFKPTLPFAGIALAYLGVRYLALGTIIGGYSGMIGGALERHLFLRWVDLSYFERIFVPIPKVINEANYVPEWTIKIAIFSGLMIALLRLYARSDPRKWVFFLLLWILSASIPLFKLWGVGQQLETSRLLFFFTMASSALLPVLMFHPAQKEPAIKLPKKADIGLGILSTIILTSMVVALAWASLSTSYLWVVAGQELKSIWQQTVKLARQSAPGQHFIVLGIPKDFHGAHVSFNGSTFFHMLRPPFITEDLSSKVMTFDPYIVGPYEVINSTRFKLALLDPNLTAVYMWRRNKNKLERVVITGDENSPENLPLPLKGKDIVSGWEYKGLGNATISGDTMHIKEIKDGDGLMIKGLNLSPMKYNFLKLDLKIDTKEKDCRALLPMGLSWNHQSTNSKRPDWVLVGLKKSKFKEFKTLTLRPSHYWRWYTEGPIKSMVLRLPENTTIDVKNIRLTYDQNSIPVVLVRNSTRLNSGEYVIEKMSDPVELAFDASQVERAEKIEIEVSKPNFFFDSYLMGEKETAVDHNLVVNMKNGFTAIAPRYFEKPAYYQIRIRALDEKEKPVGELSDPVTILRLSPGSGLDTYVE